MLKSTLALKKSDDLFEKSSMSFGDHLDELRKTLIRASMWLIAGLCVGVPSATSVVAYFQKPLEAALDDFHREQSIKEMEKTVGHKVTPDLYDWMVKNQKRTEVVFVDWMEMRDLILGHKVSTAQAAPPSTNSLKTEPDVADADGKAADQKSTDAGATETAGKTSEAEEASPSTESNALPLSDSMEHASDMPVPERLVPLRIMAQIKSQAETFKMQEGMMIWFKAALVVAFIVASPGIFYHVWGFVAAGLYPHERRYVYFFLPTSVGLFWLGALFAFFVVFRFVISFLLNFNQMMGVGTTPRLEDYMSFALLLPLGFGISFQLPLVMLIVERLGIVSVKQFLAQWRMAIFIIAFASMILTPGADVTSMIAMAGPLIFLYFLGIALCHFLPKSNMLSGTAADPR